LHALYFIDSQFHAYTRLPSLGKEKIGLFLRQVLRISGKKEKARQKPGFF
jgi:hypothetical protein